MLEDDARQQLALQLCLNYMIKSPLELSKGNLKQLKQPLQLESYLVQHNSPGTVAPIQVDSVDQKSSKLMEMAQLLTGVE